MLRGVQSAQALVQCAGVYDAKRTSERRNVLQSLMRSELDDRGCVPVDKYISAAAMHMRKVRAPQGTMLANDQAEKSDGKRRRKEDSRCPFGDERKAETVV